MMNDTVSGNGPLLVPGETPASTALRCSICTRRLGNSVASLDETGDVPAPRQSWLLCAACDTAVHAELERSPLRSPLRIRVAVGLVAADRSPKALRVPRVGLSDDAWLSFLFWGFGIFMLIHLAVIAWIAVLIR
ncbi:MAG: hypothetical protein PVSMB4_01150 [Ktedonobacterales bacterium]